ncbi:hypothetical protein NMY22_g10308 [Coprinellus aureogranulatus]|nr:hypothetical protein NMY22_g10308 [Coprinellus aureogranulatus]
MQVSDTFRLLIAKEEGASKAKSHSTFAKLAGVQFRKLGIRDPMNWRGLRKDGPGTKFRLSSNSLPYLWHGRNSTIGMQTRAEKGYRPYGVPDQKPFSCFLRIVLPPCAPRVPEVAYSPPPSLLSYTPALPRVFLHQMPIQSDTRTRPRKRDRVIRFLKGLFCQCGSDDSIRSTSDRASIAPLLGELVPEDEADRLSVVPQLIGEAAPENEVARSSVEPPLREGVPENDVDRLSIRSVLGEVVPENIDSSGSEPLAGEVAPENEVGGLGSEPRLGPMAPENNVYIHHHGPVVDTTNIVHGSVTNVGHIQNASFNLHDSGPDALLWNSLPKQRDTSGQHSEYLEGSREGDVEEILQWIDSAPPGELVLWVRGAAGVGKSTLARHLTYLLREKKRLAASVSISAVPTDARGVESVVKIIARETITIHPEVIPVIRSAVSSCHGTPLGSAIFILDATDEWEFLDAFVKELESITVSSTALRFIFLGRADPRTRGYRGSWIRPYRLEPVSNTTMGRYINKELALVKWDFGRAPSERQIANLVELADGLFIWAKVVCSLLKKKLSLSSASETLEAIIHSRRSVAAEGDLPALYHQAIVWLFPESEDQDLSLKEELGALQIRYPVGDTIPQIHPAYALFHLSFLECCKSFSTSSDVASHVSEFRSHAQLAESCLLELRKFVSNAHPLEPTNLSARQKYAVKHMPLHVHRGTPSVEPESDVDWKRTPHSSLLQDMSIPSLEQWGHLLVSLVLPSSSMAGNSEVPGRYRGGLMVDVAARLKKGPEATLPVQISCLEVAVRLEPANPHSWSELGWAYRNLAMSTRSRDACDRAVRAHRNSLKVDGLSDSDKGHMLFSLGTVLDDRHDYFGSLDDLEEAITVLRSALDARPPGHQDYENSLNNLSLALHKTGSTSDLQESIRLHLKMLELRPPGHPQRDITLHNLALTLSKTGSPDDLQESIPLYREALELRPPGHPDRHTSLGTLADALAETESPDNLQESIQLNREALEVQPPGHPERDTTLNNLAFALSKTGSPDDLEESIRYHREALELRPSGHQHRHFSLGNLAGALEKRGSPADMEEARCLREEAQAIRSSR